MNKCNYCQESNNHISGKPITQAELKPTAGYKSRSCLFKTIFNYLY